jgi:hypothetical protein
MPMMRAMMLASPRSPLVLRERPLPVPIRQKTGCSFGLLQSPGHSLFGAESGSGVVNRI